MRLKSNFKLTALFTLTTLALVGCNGSDSSVKLPTPSTGTTVGHATGTTTSAKIGQFLTGIAPVQGLKYESNGFEGTTDENGQFVFTEGKTITFSIGGITIGSTDGAAQLSPMAFYADSTSISTPVQNINRLLVMLDDDNNNDNGITIYPAIIDQADAFAQLEFDSAEFDTAAMEVVTAVALIDDSSQGLPPVFEPTEFVQVSTVAEIQSPWGDGIGMTPDGDIILSGGYDKDNILKVTPQGEVSTLVSGLPGPVGIDYDSHGNLYVANYSGNSVSKVTPEGEVSTFASGLNGPAGLLVTPEDKILVSLYGANFSGVGGTVLQFDLEGNQSIYAQGDGLSDVIGLAQDDKGRVFVSNWASGDVFKIIDGKAIKIASAGDRVNQMTYANGYIYLPTLNNNKLLRIGVYSGSDESTVAEFAGNGSPDSIDGTLTDASFYRLFNAIASEDGKQLYMLGQDGKLRVVKTAE